MTAHVARKGEPDEKSNLPKSTQSSRLNQGYIKHDVKSLGNIFPGLNNSDSSANENRTFMGKLGIKIWFHRLRFE